MNQPKEKPIKILCGCEESQAVCIEFRKRGHEAYSCDTLPCSGGHPEWHIQGDVFDAINSREWDMGVFFPPCTWLCAAMRTNAARKDRPNITPIFENERNKAYSFFLSLYNSPIPKIAIENPIGYINSHIKPSQIVRPWMFGHGYRKDVCLWLKNLPVLLPTEIVDGRKKLDFWSTDRNPNGVSLKSKTFPGIAKAMASQWSKDLIINQ